MKKFSASSPVRRVSKRDFKRSFAATQTMVLNQAPVPPTIIHTLRVLLDTSSFPPGQAEWVRDGARAILEKWQREEDIGELKRDLGLELGVPKRPRKALTVRRETTIAAAIANAALAGYTSPKKTAGDEIQADEREVQRAWKKWKPVYLGRLTAMKLMAPSKERARIRRAIDILEGNGDTK